MEVGDDLSTVSIRGMIQVVSSGCPTGSALEDVDNRSCNYGQLIEQIDYVGRKLRSWGIGRSDRVAVVLPNGCDMAVAFLGVSSNAVCAPLNPAYRTEEFEFYLNDLGARAIVIQSGESLEARDVADRLDVTVIELDSSEAEYPGGFKLRSSVTPGEALTQNASENDVAMVLHTSGTTSRPKQVPLTHRNLFESARGVARVLELSSDDRSLNVMPLFHIHGLVGVLLSSMYAGASVVCSPGYEDGLFASLMKEFKPSWYSAVPTIHQSVAALVGEDPELAANRNLRLIRSSSSALPPSLMVQLEDAFGVPVIESYGMTEAAHQMASNPLPPAQRKPGSIGLPAGPAIEIMGEDGQLLSTGVEGEIVIQGTNVTAGYLNNPDANGESFLDGWFRTGDQGRKDSDGYFYITGRIKEMINRGGETISPREIDEVLMEHPDVSQAVAFAVPHPSLEEDVAAAVVLHSDGGASERDLRQFALDRLAAFKVPSRIVLLDSIPKGPTGKVQRLGLFAALKEELGTEFVAPRDELEKSVVEAFQRILKVPAVGLRDNFFSLGGDSLKAGRVVGYLCSEYKTELSAVALFHNPTAEELSREISDRLSQDTGLLESLLDEIEAMTDEDASKQLDE